MKYVASNTSAIPERIGFKAQIIYDKSYWNREMSTITDCSLAMHIRTLNPIFSLDLCIGSAQEV